MGLHAKSCYQTTKALPTSKKADVLQLESQLLHAILPSSATKPPEAHHPVFFFFSGVWCLLVCGVLFVWFFVCFRKYTELLPLPQDCALPITCFQQLRLNHPSNEFKENKTKFYCKKWKLFLKTFSKASLPYADSDNIPTFLTCTNKKYLHTEE